MNIQYFEFPVKKCSFEFFIWINQFMEWKDWMKRNTVIFECSGIGPKMLYLGSFGSKNLSKFSFRVLEIF